MALAATPEDSEMIILTAPADQVIRLEAPITRAVDLEVRQVSLAIRTLEVQEETLRREDNQALEVRIIPTIRVQEAPEARGLGTITRVVHREVLVVVRTPGIQEAVLDSEIKVLPGRAALISSPEAIALAEDLQELRQVSLAIRTRVVLEVRHRAETLVA